VKMITRPKPPLHMVHVFATEAAGLASKLRGYPGLASKLRGYRVVVAPDRAIWVSWPKNPQGSRPT